MHMSVDTLLVKLAEIRANASGRAFILADARDADMAWGIPSFGKARTGQGFRSAPAFLEEIRAVVRQGIVDVTAVRLTRQVREASDGSVRS
jgi:hypothetical protein